MRLRIVIFILLGVLIAGSIAAPLVNSECELCGGDGKLECPACSGRGIAIHLILGWDIVTLRPCEECDSNGWIACPACRGHGKRNLLERIPDLWREGTSR